MHLHIHTHTHAHAYRHKANTSKRRRDAECPWCAHQRNPFAIKLDIKPTLIILTHAPVCTFTRTHSHAQAHAHTQAKRGQCSNGYGDMITDPHTQAQTHRHVCTRTALVIIWGDISLIVIFTAEISTDVAPVTGNALNFDAAPFNQMIDVRYVCMHVRACLFACAYVRTNTTW